MYTCSHIDVYSEIGGLSGKEDKVDRSPPATDIGLSFCNVGRIPFNVMLRVWLLNHSEYSHLDRVSVSFSCDFVW